MLPKQARGTFRKHITKPSEQVATPPSTKRASSAETVSTLESQESKRIRRQKASAVAMDDGLDGSLLGGGNENSTAGIFQTLELKVQLRLGASIYMTSAVGGGPQKADESNSIRGFVTLKGG